MIIYIKYYIFYTIFKNIVYNIYNFIIILLNSELASNDLIQIFTLSFYVIIHYNLLGLGGSQWSAAITWRSVAGEHANYWSLLNTAGWRRIATASRAYPAWSTSLISTPVCWWDPWWGYICFSEWDTYGISKFSYNLGLGLRWNINNAFFTKAAYSREFLSLKNGTLNFDMAILEFGLMFWTGFKAMPCSASVRRASEGNHSR